MATLGRPIKTRQMPWNGGMTELNHLGAALYAKPHVFEGVMNQLFSSRNYFADNALSSSLWNIGGEKEIGSMEWEWKMRGATTRPLIVLENVEPASKTKPGTGRTTIKIKFDQNWLEPGDILSPGDAGHKFQLRIMDEGQRHGNGWVYNTKLKNDAFDAFLPTKYLQPGTPWGKLWSEYEEGSVQDGSTTFSAPISFSDRMGKFRKKYEVTDYAAEQVLAIKVVGTDGKAYDTWVKYAEVEMWRQWYRELEKARFYNRKTRSIEGSTGRIVDNFSGIHEKLEDAHTHYYSELTATLIEEFLMDIFYSRVAPGADRKIKVFTGEYGMLLFSRAMNDLMTKRSWTLAGTNFNPVQKTSSKYNSNAYAVGYQFTKYIAHNGTEVEVIHNPLYDDTDINFEIDPVTGYPTESMRFTFLDFSGENNSNNIQIMSKKGGFKYGYVAGLTTPYGPAKGGLMSHSGEFYSVHVSKETGIHIEDITKCGQLILKRNVG